MCYGWEPPGIEKSFHCQALGCQAIKPGYVVPSRSSFDVIRDFLRH
jgi:hypothetical protein